MSRLSSSTAAKPFFSAVGCSRDPTGGIRSLRHRRDIDKLFVGPPGVDQHCAGCRVQHRIGGPARARLGLERVDVTDGVDVWRSTRGAVPSNDCDPGRGGRRATELIVGSAARRREGDGPARRVTAASAQRQCPLGQSRGDRQGSGYSHSMVPGGFDVTSSTTRFTPAISLVMRLEMRASTSYGRRVQSAVIASSDDTGRSTIGCP